MLCAGLKGLESLKVQSDLLNSKNSQITKLFYSNWLRLSGSFVYGCLFTIFGVIVHRIFIAAEKGLFTLMLFYFSQVGLCSQDLLLSLHPVNMSRGQQIPKQVFHRRPRSPETVENKLDTEDNI